MRALMPLLVIATAAWASPTPAQPVTCADPLKPMLRAELLFGRNIGNRLGVSERQWRRFVDRELTPRFPDGLSTVDGKGQWRDGGTIVREPSKIVVVVMADDPGAHERLAAAASAYIRQFKQKSVGVVTRPVCAAF